MWPGRRGPFLNTEYSHIYEEDVPTAGRSGLRMRLGPVDPVYNYWGPMGVVSKLVETLRHGPDPVFDWDDRGSETLLHLPGVYLPEEEGVQGPVETAWLQWGAAEDEPARGLTEAEMEAIEREVRGRTELYRSGKPWGPKDWKPRRKLDGGAR